MTMPEDVLRRKVLEVAGDNDGLWEFLKIIDPDLYAARKQAQCLVPAISGLVREGLLVIEDENGVELSPEGAFAVLTDHASWVFPWERPENYPRAGQLYGVFLTPLGEDSLRSLHS